MRYIQKFFKSKNSIEQFIEENGMEQAIKEFGINKLLMYKLISQYEGTELYYYEYITIHKVYDIEGNFLGDITPIMSPYYKELGHFFGPCKNGNIILSKLDEEKLIKTYGVFDKDGKSIVPYGRYHNHEFLPSGVALMGIKNELMPNVTTIHYDGTFNVQLFENVETIMGDGEYEYILHKNINGEDKTLKVNKEVMNELMYNATIALKSTEKGID